MFDLELKHSVDWLKTLISHPMQNVIFMLHSRKNFYLAVVNLFKLLFFIILAKIFFRIIKTLCK